MAQIYSKLNNKKVESILDLATGQGGFIEEICKELQDFTSAIAVDSSSKAIDAALKKDLDNRISFREMDCENLEFEKESFDIVSICNSIHHLKDRDKVLGEALRVLKKGGFFIVSEMYHSHLERPSQSTHSDFHHWWGNVDSALGNYHGKTFDRETLLNIVQSLPLDSVEFEQFDGLDEDIYSEDIQKHLTDAFEMYKKRAENLENASELIAKGEGLINKMKKDGFSPASRLEFICQK